MESDAISGYAYIRDFRSWYSKFDVCVLEECFLTLLKGTSVVFAFKWHAGFFLPM